MWTSLEEARVVASGVHGRIPAFSTAIITMVHQLQVLNESLPEAEHDFSVDLIVTPEEIIRCEPSRRPRGLVWKHLSPEQIAAIPFWQRDPVNNPRMLDVTGVSSTGHGLAGILPSWRTTSR